MAKASVEYSGGSPAGVMKQLVAAAREGVEEAAGLWDRDMLDDHFEPGAAEKYGYEKRSGEDEPAYVPSARGIVLAGGKSKYGAGRVKQNPKYFHRKKREGFGTTALVRTGETKRMALSGGRVTSRVRGGVVEGVDAIPVPHDGFFKRSRTSKVDKPKELTSTTGAEEAVLARAVENTAHKRLGSSGRRESKRIR
jgi:hypothetical protein